MTPNYLWWIVAIIITILPSSFYAFLTESSSYSGEETESYYSSLIEETDRPIIYRTSTSSFIYYHTGTLKSTLEYSTLYLSRVNIQLRDIISVEFVDLNLDFS